MKNVLLTQKDKIIGGFFADSKYCCIFADRNNE